jgi:oxygen-independent coproporphyrinogen-3 oxidase
MNEGVDAKRWRECCPEAPWTVVDALLARLEEDLLATRADGIVRLTNRGRLLADSVGAEIMEAFAGEPVPA